MSADTVVVGASGADAPLSNQGAAYVFVKPASGWVSTTQTAKLSASDGAAIDSFGVSAAIDAGTVIVGAGLADAPSSNQGAAYLFTKPATGWADATETDKLTASGAAAGDRLGNAVAVSGNTVVAGAPILGFGPSVGPGAAYVFELTASPQALLATVLADIQGLAPEPGTTQAILDAATGQLIKAIAWLDAGEINRARNNLNDFRYHALAILDITEGNPTGIVRPCFLVALDVVEGVLVMLGG